jgi:hypothetical protein
MANDKINEKRLVEKIKARILLESGKKITQQDLIDKCISYSYNHFDNFMQEKIEIPKLSKEKIKKILDSAVEFEDHYPDKTDDELIYGS